MAYYDDDILTADELLREFGVPAQLVRMTTVAPNPDEPWKTVEPEEDSQEVQCVFLDFATQTQNALSYFQGTQILRGDKKILMGCNGLVGEVPLQSVIRRADGQQWKIEALKCLSPNGQRILYTLMGRQ